MSNRFHAALFTVIAVVWLAPLPAAGQAAADAEALPRIAWGHPDLQGVWDFRTITPLERTNELANKEFFTDEEAAEFEREGALARNADLNRERVVTDRKAVNGTTETADLRLAYNNFWWDRGTRVVGTKRTSLVVDPPNGEDSRPYTGRAGATSRPCSGERTPRGRS